MDETLLQILEAQDDRITTLEEKLASLMAYRAVEKANDAALFKELVSQSHRRGSRRPPVGPEQGNETGRRA